MQWVKSHLTYVITASIGVLAIAALIMGMMMSTVKEDMEKDRGIVSSLDSIKPVNMKVIEARKKEGEVAHDKVQKVQTDLESKGDHKPIVTQVFPKLDPTNLAAPYLFKDEYKKRQQYLLVEVLHAMDAPNEDEFKRGVNWMINQKAKAQLANVLGVTQTKPAGARPGVGIGLYNSPANSGAGGVTAAQIATLTQEEDLQAKIRVSIQRAKQIYCYATPPTLGNPGSLDPRPTITDGNVLPSVDEMWYAQMSLWIQEDVLGALAQLNNSVAEKLPEKDRWVAHLPVKHLSNIWIGNPVPPSGGTTSTGARFAASGGTTGVETGPPPGDSASVLTQRGTTAGTVDVVQLALKLVVNAQSLPTVIDEICKAGFYTPLRVTYEAISPTTDLVGYIYGSDPVIQVRLEFEGCFMRPKYTKWMPESVAKDISEGKAGTQLSVGSGAGSSPSMRRGGSESPMQGRREGRFGNRGS